MDAQWDNLLLLDACRYDMFKEVSTLPGKLECRVSRGSSTMEFMVGNFQGKSLHDTVYVTANPQFYRHREWMNTSFHAVINIWKQDGWDKVHNTVLPETVVERAIRASDRYPNKRLLIHFIQPHYPFISDSGNPFEDTQAFLKPKEPGSWDQVMTGEITADPEKVWQAYRGNLIEVLPSVKKLLEILEGWTVVTADHGNMVGERASPIPIVEWGHPRGIYTPELVNVPWLIVRGNHREIEPGEPINREEGLTDSHVEERLRNLGYQ